MKQKILIVEDKKPHMDALCKILSELDKKLEIIRAYNGQEAFRYAMEQHIHLFLVDIVLDVKNPSDVTGLRFVQEIREVKRYAFVPVIFITSLEDPKMYSYSQLHCFGYIEKPFAVAQVKEYVTKALDFPVVSDKERFVYFRKDGIVYSKRISEIIYIESSRRRIRIYCVNDVLEIPYKTCEEILREIDSTMFVRCSRYVIINKEYIEQIDYANRYVQLKHIDKPVEIGTMLKNKFKNVIQNGTNYR